MSETDKQNYINDEYKAMLLNHEKRLEIANNEMGEVKVDLAGIKNDVGWLKKTYWVVVGSSIGGLITGLFNLLWK